MGHGLPHSMNNAIIRPKSVDESDGESMQWKGYWAPGRYNKNDTVLDGVWLMVANKETNDRAAPQISGPPVPGIIGDPVWVNSSDPGVVYSGHEYTFTSVGRLTAIKVWVPTVGPTISHKLYMRDVTLGSETAVLTEIPINIDVAGEWVEIGIGAILINFNAVLQVLIESKDVTGTVETVAPWVYDFPAIGPPADGQWKLDYFDSSIMYISDVDSDLVDRSALLASLQLGDTMTFVQADNANKLVKFEVTRTPEDSGNGYFIVDVITIEQGSEGWPDGDAECDNTITQETTQSVDYVVEDDYWLSNTVPFADVQGLLQVNAGLRALPDNNVYGIDIVVRGGYLSADWDLAASTTAIG